MAKVYATGKRKTAVAKVWLSSGSGKLLINDMSLNEWLGGHEAIKKKLLQPLVITKQPCDMESQKRLMNTTERSAQFSSQRDC